MNKLFIKIAIVAALSSIYGCATQPRSAMQGDIPKEIAPIKVPAKESVLGNGVDGSLDVDIGITKDAFLVKPLDTTDPLPDQKVEIFNVSNASIFEVLRTLLSRTKIAFSVMPNSQGQNVQYGTINAMNVTGKLNDVIEEMSESLGFFYTYSNNVLRVSPDSQFVVTLPPLEEMFQGISDTITALGGRSVYVDKAGRVATFYASKPVFKRIQGYLNHVRENRSLIVYDTYVYQVDLNDSTQGAINWNKLASGSADGKLAFSLSGSAQTAMTGGIALSTVYNTAQLSLDTLVKFLQSQGNLKTISQPKIMMISGTKGKFKNGTSTSYVSQVGTTAAGASGTLQTTVNTATVLSGLDMTIGGDIEDGTVYSDIKLALADLIRFNNFTALGTTLALPQTATREVETKARTRPGDSILIAGINISRENHDVAGFPGTGDKVALPTDVNKAVSRSELVIILRPRVIRFVEGTKS